MNTTDFIDKFLKKTFPSSAAPYHLNILEELQGNIVENSHTNILIKLLAYKSRCGYVFLKSFCDRFFSNFTGDLTRNDIVFETESPLVSNPHERIDGLIYSNDNFVIIFENKINGAGTMPCQLKRYIEDVRKNPNIFTQPKEDYENIWVVYLTRDGIRLPDPCSIIFLKEKFGCNMYNDEIDRDTAMNNGVIIGDRYAGINYRDDILVWLKEDVLPIAPFGDLVLVSAIIQYIDYLERLFDCGYANAQTNAIDDYLREEINKEECICEKNMSLVELYNEVNRRLRELDDNQRKERELLNELKKSIVRVNRELISDFIRASRDYFEGIYPGGIRLFDSTYVEHSLDFRYVFFNDARWPKNIHFEWLPLRDKLCKDKEYTLCFHIEDNRLVAVFSSSSIVSLLSKQGFTKVPHHRFAYSKKVTLPMPILTMNFPLLKSELIKVYQDSITKDIVDEINNVLGI